MGYQEPINAYMSLVRQVFAHSNERLDEDMSSF